MPDHFADRLGALIAQHGPVCAGLDPRPQRLPEGFDDPLEWAALVVALLRDRVAAFKPQLAFFDDDWSRVEEIAKLQTTALKIADCKRGDIGSTAEAYARRIVGAESRWDAATINPYLGRDSLEPFLEEAARHGKGLFVLVKTSNPGATDLQDLELAGGGTVCERVATLVDALGKDHVGEDGRSLVGAVVGLTAPADLIRRLRALMPRAYFLLPGYGAQGGDPAALRAALDERGGGVLVSASRSLTFPWGDRRGPADWNFRGLVEGALDEMKQALERAARGE